MKTCEDCGCRVYSMGCVNCNEQAYIDEQDSLTDIEIREAKKQQQPADQVSASD